MNRRDFLALASTAGLGVVAGTVPFLGRARAGETYGGPFWILVHAGGGWDPTSLCDPKGTDDPEDPKRLNNYLKKDIGKAGAISYAPVGNNAEFFGKHHDRLLVINGIDCATNSHDAGTRVTWCGSLVDNRPAFAALVAGIYAPTKPMAFITNGGYDTTAGVVAPTRVGNIDALRRIAYPDQIDPGNGEATFHTPETTARIQEARRERHLAYSERQNLPRLKQALSTLYLARTGQNELKKVTEYLPDAFEQGPLKRQAQVAIAAYRAGVCVAANLSIGGFDTHGNHDQSHFPRLAELLDGLDYVFTELEKHPETKGNAVVVVGSDFGRTPGYNSGNGKDHWSITSMMLWGKGIEGNRVVGETDDGHNPKKVDPKTLEASDTGVRITPGHVHRALRRLAGIDENEIAARFPISEPEEMPLFG